MAGIISYGAYIPKFRIKVEEIAKQYGKDPEAIKKGLLVNEKSVPSYDEDSVTMAVEACLNALVDIDKSEIGALFCGSESKVYAVKPNSSIIGSMIGLGNDFSAADFEFACKAGTAALQCILGLVKSGIIKKGMAIGSDTAQSKPGDVLEYSASAGAASFVIGKEDIVAEIKSTCSVTTDTPDFWRRSMQAYPEHAERFTGEPAYFRHTIAASEKIMKSSKLKPDDFDYCVFHTPNGKFPLKAAQLLGFSKEQAKYNLIVSEIGNTYSAASLIGLTYALDNCKGDERILLCSFGSGAGSDAFILEVNKNISDIKGKTKSTLDYVNNKEYVDYATYSRLMHRG